MSKHLRIKEISWKYWEVIEHAHFFPLPLLVRRTVSTRFDKIVSGCFWQGTEEQEAGTEPVRYATFVWRQRSTMSASVVSSLASLMTHGSWKLSVATQQLGIFLLARLCLSPRTCFLTLPLFRFKTAAKAEPAPGRIWELPFLPALVW